MLGDVSSSELDSSALELPMGVLGRLEVRRPFRALITDVVCGRLKCIFVGFLTAFNVPGLGTLRLKLTVVWRMNLAEDDLFGRTKADRARLDPISAVFRLRARFSRDAI